MENSAIMAIAPLPGFGNLGQRLDKPIHHRRGRNNIAADNDHHHLHGEGNQSPEVLAALDSQFAGGLMQQQPDDENDHDPRKGKDQRIRKPLFAPV